MGRYLNPYTDFGFKKLFGEEANKDLLIDFLNQLLPLHHHITELIFRNVEGLPELSHDRKAIFDIHCQTQSGEKIIVEMQKAKVNFFKDRSLFYSTFPIREQAKRGDWDFRLTPIYMIAVLDFQYDEQEEKQKFLRSIKLKDQDGDTFYDKLNFKFIQMPLFNKSENELENHFDKWIYFLKKLEFFETIPAILNEPIFEKAFTIAEVANMTPQQYAEYQESLLIYIEVKEIVKTAEDEGRTKEKLEIAKKLKGMELSKNQIKEATGLSDKEIDGL
ncbi:MAG: Rpn family recombination-promoting nuclease/putative transposase [Runella slithyformis]|nr:MAG: Rpn family recombination-promoting nuclease/putative transposase [Runella sp.]TAG17673.1 MAG: Rpn family recombination-promoting nuclease/putative transposase [Cytophagales bacterium]TAG38903.1 MAG: Rpn family recombination-promoting nuclease/putative transposase [Cytophagia bacterium]TAG78258.1 MAG: Rpn family recombination-promoting nuclease/putative transposase [Cytophagales bacterium]TAH13280.1 MAG: Rpn family recombination-promoting nuclease/putative transposase [Runella slithyform